MRDVYEQLLRDGEPGIQRLIDARTQENVTLDFKLKVNSKNGQFEKEDRAQLGKLLSAFANSAGGLAIWGINARKGDDGIDCAQPPGKPIQEIERFRSEAQTLAGQLLMPRHEGTYVAHISAASCPGAGYLLVLVDRSERRPHRCEATGEKQYFKRAGDSTFAMEHYDIEDAFRRAVASEVEIVCTPTKSPPFNTPQDKVYAGIDFKVGLKNIGENIAKFPYLKVKTIQSTSFTNLHILPINQLSHLRDGDGWHILSSGSDTVIHPGETLIMAGCRSNLRVDRGVAGMCVPRVEVQNSIVEFSLEGGCENGRLKSFKARYDTQALDQILRDLG